MITLYIGVVLDKPMQTIYTYSIPDSLKRNTDIGKRVIVPFGRGNREEIGYIISIREEKPKFKTKDIINIIDDDPIFSDYEIGLAKWIAKYYVCSLGEAIAKVIPKEHKGKRFKEEKFLKDKIKFAKNIEQKSLLKLNEEQTKAFTTISKSIDGGRFETYLLHGITGSGKTEVYRHLAKKVSEKNKYTLILVPEISLTPQNIVRFTEIFGSDVAVLHSKISSQEKVYNYTTILRGEIKVVLGARSAIFSPSKHLGLIIIDEEHETSYKAGDTPRYNAKQVAYKICRDKSIPLVMGTATPLIETYYNTETGKVKLLTMTQRHAIHSQQEVKLIDLRKEREAVVFSKTLLEHITDRLEKKEQTLIFLNRRGYSTFLMCTKCSHTEECPHCGIPYTYHKHRHRLICHYCGFQVKPPLHCSECGSDKLKYFGFGTEQIDNKLQELFPSAVIERMDVDTTRGKNSYTRITNKMRKKEIDILVGTQMIAKGIHFPNITLVGVVLADVALNIPDFRSSERTFSLLTQVSGRAGRGEKKGEVLIQTYNPEHYAIQYALTQDYENFYKEEIGNRKEYGWVPFRRIIRMVMRGTNLDTLIDRVTELYDEIRSSIPQDAYPLGPAPCPIERINRNYRYQLILSAKNISSILGVAEKAKCFSKKQKGVYLEIDVDPISMM